MSVDVVTLLRELDVNIADGSGPGAWLLRPPGADGVQVELEPSVERITARTIKGKVFPRLDSMPRQMFVGRTITRSMLDHAEGGLFDVLTEDPLQLIINGTYYTTQEPESLTERIQPNRRPAWIRWATERYLLLADGPARQGEIAEALGATQQAISKAVRRLGPLVAKTDEGLIAPDRAALLGLWLSTYEGPHGQEFGWYSLAPIVEQTLKAVDVAELLEAHPLISGDVAADRLAPWKLPTRGRIYVDSPIDLAGDGFVPSPLDEATLITCIPQDPTLFRLSDMGPGAVAEERRLADAATVCWDVLNSGDMDGDQAAEQLKELIAKERVW